jgi:hypothetical protein
MCGRSTGKILLKVRQDQEFQDWKAWIQRYGLALKKILQRPRFMLPKFQSRVDKIDKDAERVEKWILTQLDLKVKHASLKESRNRTTLSTAIIGFTVITIIFTPLSFLSTLFALPIESFQQQQQKVGDASVYTRNYIGTWMSTSSTQVELPYL